MATIEAKKPTNRLLKSLQAEVAKRVKASGLPPSDFAFIDVDDATVITSLLYVPDHNFHFDFFPSETNWIVRYSPGEHIASEIHGVGVWAPVLESVDLWLGYLKRELNTPDPWVVFAELSTPFRIGGDSDDNTTYSKAERDTISRQLAEIKTYLLEEGLKRETDRHAVIARLDDIEEGLGRLGRSDWIWFALGVLMQLALVGYVTSDGVRYVVEHWFGETQRLLTS